MTPCDRHLRKSAAIRLVETSVIQFSSSNNEYKCLCMKKPYVVCSITCMAHMYNCVALLSPLQQQCSITYLSSIIALQHSLLHARKEKCDLEIPNALFALVERKWFGNGVQSEQNTVHNCMHNIIHSKSNQQQYSIRHAAG